MDSNSAVAVDGGGATAFPSGDAVSPTANSVWNLDWLTPLRCRNLLVLLLAFGFLGHLFYLHFNCPIDLSGDEAQYWEWSRNLDWSYYSKGPLVAYIIRASCAIFGDTMQGVRYPALVLSTLTSIVTYLLARRLFRSDRIALGAVLLYHIVPMFVAGSLLMTIDPPFFFCWALATYLLALALFDGKTKLWPIIGVVVGVGFLAKYAMFLWFVPMLLAILLDREFRPLLRRPGPWLAIGIAALFTTPVLIWNIQHDWVSLKHVATQTGTDTGGKFSVENFVEFFGGQLGVLGPGAVILMIGAAVYAIRTRKPRVVKTGETRSADPFARQMNFLLIIGLTFFAFNFFTAFRAKVQMNWPAPAYFTLLILVAYFLSTRLADTKKWKPWKWWFWFSVAFGLVTMPIAHHPTLIYPFMNWLNPKMVALKEHWANEKGIRGRVSKRIPEGGVTARTYDFTAKLKGWQEIGAVVSGELKTLGEGSFILCHDYQQAAELAFYAEQHPKTHYAASYYARRPGRWTQYDLWPDRSLDRSSPRVGKNAVFLGNFDRPPQDLLKAFERVEGITVVAGKVVGNEWVVGPETRAIPVNIVRKENVVRTFRYFRCYGFKGMERPLVKPKN